MLSEKAMATGHETRNAGRHWQAGEQKKRRKLNVACYTETYLFLPQLWEWSIRGKAAVQRGALWKLEVVLADAGTQIMDHRGLTIGQLKAMRMKPYVH
jgi:hypothetical protein